MDLLLLFKPRVAVRNVNAHLGTLVDSHLLDEFLLFLEKFSQDVVLGNYSADVLGQFTFIRIDVPWVMGNLETFLRYSLSLSSSFD